MTARALVLDFGGVITRTLFETHALTERALGLAAGTLTWRGPFDPGGDPLWCAMQKGDISERDYWATRTREVAALIGANWREMKDFVIATRGSDPLAVIRPQALAALDRAKAAGVKLAILSNELDLFYGKDFREKLPFLKDFAAIVDATHTEILKPDPRAYTLVTAALALDPGDCVFVDDQKRNIDGAARAGMIPVHFDVRHPGVSFDAALAHFGL